MDADHRLQVQPRWPWLVAGGLLLAAALAAAISVHLLWIPCAGSPLAGTVFASEDTPTLSDACLRRMDEAFPFVGIPGDAEFHTVASWLSGLAVALAAVSWIVLIVGLHLRSSNKRIALSAAVAPTALAVMVWVAPETALAGWVWLAGEAVAALVWLVLVVRLSDFGAQLLWGLTLVLFGATAFGPAHLALDFMVMASISQLDGNVPPGTGWITVGVLVVTGLASFAFASAAGARPAGDAAAVSSPPA